MVFTKETKPHLDFFHLRVAMYGTHTVNVSKKINERRRCKDYDT